MIGCMVATFAITTGAIVWPEWRRLQAVWALETAYKTRDPRRIKKAIVSLEETRDVRVVPYLIETMYYEDDAEVQLAAYDALCQLGHRPEGFGAPDPREATVAEWVAEIEQWKSWYRSIRPHIGVDEIEAASRQVNSWMQPTSTGVKTNGKGIQKSVNPRPLPWVRDSEGGWEV
jgi:hypothetical protein